MGKDYIFPEGFLWGSATSAFQVEGDCLCHDFYDWALKGKIRDGTSPVDAVHFLKYYEKDIALMKKMHHNTARIGVEWARIEPEKGKFVEETLEQYRDLLRKMRDAGILPMVTLHHFANPLWLTGQGGWSTRDAVPLYLRFVEKTVRFLGDLVHSWITINEPSVYAVSAYLFGEFPPGRKNPVKAFKVMRIMADAHRAAYTSIHEIYRQKQWGAPKVGVAKHLRTFDPRNTKNPLDRLAAWFMDRYFNDYFLDLINREKPTLDIFGINYYTGDLVKFPMKQLGRENLAKNKLGWDIYPEGFYRILKRYYARYRLPVYITENGTCDDADELRPRFILDHLYQVHRAITDGVNVAGYYHWSTMDNFELVDGLMARFGLVHVDHDSPERKRVLKKSGELYGEIARANGITEAAFRGYVPDWQP